ncbi:MAG: flagellar biosynthetic protein FliO [Brevinematia bacterium]
MFRKYLLVLIILFLLSGLLYSQETNTNAGFLDRYYQQEQLQTNRGIGGIIIDILNILLTLLIVIAILYVAIRFLKKATGSPADDYGVIEVMASKAIAQGISIFIIRIGKDYYVMSSGDKGLNLITKLEDKELINILNVEKSKDASKIKEDFIDVIISFFRKKEKDESGIKNDFSSERIEFLKKQKQKFKEWE